MLDTGSSGNVSRITELPDKPITDPIVPPCGCGCNGLEELVVSRQSSVVSQGSERQRNLAGAWVGGALGYTRVFFQRVRKRLKRWEMSLSIPVENSPLYRSKIP